MTDHNTVAPTDYKRADVGRLVSYVEREREATLHDRHGREMDRTEVQQLIDLSERHEMSRHIIISPENADRLDRERLREATKRMLRDTIGQREGVEYGYTVHMEGGDRPHAHVVATGRAEQRGDPLWLDQADLEQLSDRAHERAQEQDRGLGRVRDQALEQLQEHERDHDRGHSLR